jgi:hypothetical protein
MALRGLLAVKSLPPELRCYAKAGMEKGWMPCVVGPPSKLYCYCRSLNKGMRGREHKGGRKKTREGRRRGERNEDLRRRPSVKNVFRLQRVRHATRPEAATRDILHSHDVPFLEGATQEHLAGPGLNVGPAIQPGLGVDEAVNSTTRRETDPLSRACETQQDCSCGSSGERVHPSRTSS